MPPEKAGDRGNTDPNPGATGSQRTPEASLTFSFQWPQALKNPVLGDSLGPGLIVLGSEYVSSENQGLGSTHSSFKVKQLLPLPHTPDGCSEQQRLSPS